MIFKSRKDAVLAAVLLPIVGFFGYLFYKIFKIIKAVMFFFGCLACASGEHSDYPASVTLRFTHDKVSYERSFTTVIHPSAGNALETCGIYWNLGQTTFPITLQDGGLLLASVEWDYCSHLQRDGDHLSRNGRWMWLDHYPDPTMMVHGYPGLQDSTDLTRVPPVDGSELDFMITRLPKSELPHARDSDETARKGSIRYNGNFFSTSSYKGTGQLFAGLLTTKIDKGLVDGLTWISTSEKCRVAFFPQSVGGHKISLSVYRHDIPPHYAVKLGPTWDLDKGPPSKGPYLLFPAAATEPHPGDYQSPGNGILARVQDVTVQNLSCRLPPWQDGATGAAIDFGGDFRVIEPSGSWVELMK